MFAADLNLRAGVGGKGSRVVSGWALIRRQFLALFIKRFHYARRSRKGLIAQVMAAVCQADEGSKRGYAKYTLAFAIGERRGVIERRRIRLVGGERRREAMEAERNGWSLRCVQV